MTAGPGDERATTVVVTGAAGMLGTHLVQRLLDTGARVRGVDRRGSAVPAHPRLEHVEADIRDTAAMRRAFGDAAAVVHCASALPSYPADVIRSVIVDGTQSVLDAAGAAEVPRVVQISSTAVYGLPKIVPTTEDHPREPVDTYSEAKADAEVVADKARADGMCLTTLRPKTFLGPGRMGLFAMLFEWAEEGRNFPVLGHGDVRVQMLAVQDLVTAIESALAAPPDVAIDTYNIAAADFGTLREDFQAVLDAAGHGRRVVGVPARPAVAVLSLLQRVRLSPVYGRLLYKLLADSYVSIAKAQDRLGYAPAYSNRDTILATYAWWREQLHAPTGDGNGNADGITSREPWKQGALAAAKVLF
ncbi:NAD-dependent epimerase/dehydratase family protein [Dactylosporangium aurantiacum]|uniref:NAD-dependent epimerase/dehydratase family protein n=1 Tax=Dactylosporangium aurantiacum TaxID=35754 RepID=UPI000A95C486|nr:NAD-dependent epimerase/dehydratase family protein [Dactylosporangium aurantiacum]MDG6106285.1 NAD-dependent epimerase/dehydratase family protein [Dactylosporangium aurantiacum]